MEQRQQNKVCFFIGHRDAPVELRPRLDDAIERHITQYGVTEFIVGHYGRFDAMSAEAVRKAKKRHPETSLVLLLPYYPIKDIKELSAYYDATFYPPGMENVPMQFAIVKANEYMIRTSNYLICYNTGLVGKTRDYVMMARHRNEKGLICITNLADAI